MGTTEQVVENLAGYSKAKYTTWIFYEPDRLLLDAGEGVSTALENFIYGIEHIFISHGHYDHIGGIPGILRSRLSSRGDKEKPIDIYYPERCRPVTDLRGYVDRSIDLAGFEVRWHEVQDGQSIQIRTGGEHREVRAFRTRHIRNQLTLGYSLVEHRKRLRPEFEGLSQAEIRDRVTAPQRRDDLSGEEKKQLIEEIRAGMMEHYDRKLFVFSGDAMPLSLEDVAEAELLIHDTTFLHARDRDHNTHATLEEAMQLTEEGRCGGLLAFHVSRRYTVGELKRAAEKLVARLKPSFPIWYLDFKAGLRRSPTALPSNRLQQAEVTP